METVHCNLCNSNEFQILYELPDWQFNNFEYTARLVQCKNCGLIYQNPRPTALEMTKFYPPDYENFLVEEKQIKSSRLMGRIMQYGMYKRRRVVLRETQKGDLLDVGCATGIFLEMMRATPGWQVKGVEINDHAASIARNKGLDVVTSSLEHSRFQDNQFDVITLWDVLEHLHNPLEGLREIRRLLKPGGILVLRVPNGDSMDAEIFGPYWAGLEPPRHLFVFDENTLTRYLKKTGFTVNRISCEIGSYPTFVLSLQFWMVAKAIPLKWREYLSRLLYSPVARVISFPPFFVIGLFKKGPLLIVTASRN